MSIAEKYQHQLSSVTTVKTVAELWKKNRTTVIYHIMRDNIAATKDSGVYLVALGSVIDLWGFPPNLPEYEPLDPISLLQKEYKAS